MHHQINSYNEAKLYPRSFDCIQTLYELGFRNYKSIPSDHHADLFRCASDDTDAAGDAADTLCERLALNTDIMFDCLLAPNKRNWKKMTAAITGAFEAEYRVMIDDIFSLIDSNEKNPLLNESEEYEEDEE